MTRIEMEINIDTLRISYQLLDRVLYALKHPENKDFNCNASETLCDIRAFCGSLALQLEEEILPTLE